MPKVKLLHKTSGETVEYGCFENYDMEKCVVEAEVVIDKKGAFVYVKGSELVRVGVNPRDIKPEYKYIFANFEEVKG